MMAFFSFVFSLVPVLGSGLVWGPAGLWLIFTGRLWAGVFIIAYGALVLGSVDNIIKPFLTKGSLRLPPALVFVSIFGGLAAFGAIGAIIGPLVAAAAGAFIRMWRVDFLRLPPDGAEAPPPKT
jgi:predicted PurR-regulated permease PerM